MTKKLIALLCFVMIGSGLAVSQEAIPDTAAAQLAPPPPPAPAPPARVWVEDKPNDAGHGLIVKWDLSPDDGAGQNNVAAYEIFKANSPDGEFKPAGVAPKGIAEYGDSKDIETEADYIGPNSTWYYKIQAVSDQQARSPFSETASGTTIENWLHTGKIPIGVAAVIFTLFLVVNITSAKKGKIMYVRPLAGINAVDDAIGRATEMGKPILYILGMGTAGDIATIAGFTILSRVAKRTAEYQTKVIVPVQDPVVLAVAQETVRTAYMEAGRPDQYNADNVFFVTSMQFPYVAAVNGIMLRERPATNFYMGTFYAESLILAETGNTAGSIQISGTDQVAQLPFFVAATDYTLIGEELYAASAYLSQEPVQLGTLKAQDYTKAIVMIFIILGAIAITAGWPFLRNLVTINL